MYDSQTLPIKSSKHSSSEVAVSSRCRILGIHINPSGTAGTVQLKDGGSGGTVLLDISSPADANAHKYIRFPGSINFQTNCYVSLSNVTDVTLFLD